MQIFAEITGNFIIHTIDTVYETDIKLNNTKIDNSYIKKVFFGPYKLFSICLRNLNDPTFLQNYSKIFKVATQIIGIVLLILPLIASFVIAFPFRHLLDPPVYSFPPPIRVIPSFLSIVDCNNLSIQNPLILNVDYKPVKNFVEHGVNEDIIVKIGTFLNARNKLNAMSVSKEFLKYFRHADLWSSYLEHPGLRILGAVNKLSNHNVAEASHPYDQLKAFRYIKKTLRCDEFANIARLMPGGPLAYLKIPELSTVSELDQNHNASIVRGNNFLALRIKDYHNDNSDITFLIFVHKINEKKLDPNDINIRKGCTPKDVYEFYYNFADYKLVQEKNQYFEKDELDLKNEDVQTSVLNLLRGLKFENSLCPENNSKDIRLI